MLAPWVSGRACHGLELSGLLSLRGGFGGGGLNKIILQVLWDACVFA